MVVGVHASSRANVGVFWGNTGSKASPPLLPRWQEKGWERGGAGHVVGAGAYSHSA